MDEYIANYESYTKYIVYDFRLGDGGIGDCCKFFMHLLCMCITHKYRICYLINNIIIEKYLRLKYDKFYIQSHELPSEFLVVTNINEIVNSNCNLIRPYVLYNVYSYDAIIIKLNDIFEFSQPIHSNYDRLFPHNITSYVSIHLRLGDRYLETDKSFVVVKHDQRYFNEGYLFRFI
jgi:hypothetical protein